MTKREFIQQVMISMSANPKFADLDVSEIKEGVPYLRVLPMVDTAEGIADILERSDCKFDEEY